MLHFLDRLAPPDGARFREQAPDQVIRKTFRDFSRRQPPLRAEPTHAPVQRSQNGARCQCWIAWHKFSGSRARRNQLTHSLLITVALRDQAALLPLWQRTRQ